MRLCLLLLLIMLHTAPGSTYAQAIDNTLSFKNINSDRYVRYNYENDVFSLTDQYYTQGMNLELVAPWIRQFPLSRLLPHPRWGYSRHGLAFQHNGYTPTSISSDNILYGDRPFAACLFLNTFRISIDTVRKQRFSSTLSTGVIGQAAGGMEMQVGIHKWLNNIDPHGWPNQLHNDAILNYQANYEKQLLSYGKIFSLNATASARLGTLSDKATLGGTFMFGYFDSPFSAKTATKNNFRIYLYETPLVNFIGYDATLQGGLFNRSSPYTLTANDITRITFQNCLGVVVTYRRFYLEYFQSFLTNEFKTGNYHVWGGVQIAFGL